MNNTNIQNCTQIHEITNLKEFYDCYSFFFKQNITKSTFAVILIVGTIVMNAALIYLIKKSSNKLFKQFINF